MTDSAPVHEHQPERTCVGCFKRFPQAQLLAVTRLKDGSIVFEPAERPAGRSVYLCASMKCFDRATKRKGKNAFEYGLKVKIPQDIFDRLQHFLSQSLKK